jgi:hypothetical protein
MRHQASIVAAGLLAATFLASTTARADTVVVQPAEPVETVTATGEVTSPNTPVIVSGVMTFGISYGIAVVAASISDNSADRRMFVPVIGPWLDLADRPSCPVEEVSCDTSTGQKILIGADGVLQALGVVVAVYGILTPVHHRTGPASVQVVPVSMGRSGHGFAVRGAF